MPENKIQKLDLSGLRLQSVLMAWQEHLEKWRKGGMNTHHIHRYGPKDADFIPVSVFKKFIDKVVDVRGPVLDDIILQGTVTLDFENTVYKIFNMVSGFDSPAKMLLYAILHEESIEQDEATIKKHARIIGIEKSKQQRIERTDGAFDPLAWFRDHLDPYGPDRDRTLIRVSKEYVENMTPVLEKLVEWLKKQKLDGHVINFMESKYGEVIKADFISLMKNFAGVKESVDLDNEDVLSAKAVGEIIRELISISKFPIKRGAMLDTDFLDIEQSVTLVQLEKAKKFTEEVVSISTSAKKYSRENRQLALQRPINSLLRIFDSMAHEGKQYAIKKYAEKVMVALGEVDISTSLRNNWVQSIVASAQIEIPQKVDTTQVAVAAKTAMPGNNTSGPRLLEFFTLTALERWGARTIWKYDNKSYALRDNGTWMSADPGTRGRSVSPEVGKRFLEEELRSQAKLIKAILKSTMEKDVIALIKVIESLPISDIERNVWLVLFKARLNEFAQAGLDEACISNLQVFAMIKAIVEIKQYGRKRVI